MTCKAAVTGGLSAGPAERECVGCEVARFLWRGPGQHVAAFGIGDGDLVPDERPAGRVRSRDVAATAFLVWSLPLGMSLIGRSEEHTSELQSHVNLVCRLLLEKKKKKKK